MAALVSGGDFTRADLRQEMLGERASLLQMLIWLWHDEHDVKPTQQEFADAYRRWFGLWDVRICRRQTLSVADPVERRLRAS